MNVMKIVESVLTYFLTAGFVATVTYFSEYPKGLRFLKSMALKCSYFVT